VSKWASSLINIWVRSTYNQNWIYISRGHSNVYTYTAVKANLIALDTPFSWLWSYTSKDDWGIYLFAANGKAWNNPQWISIDWNNRTSWRTWLWFNAYMKRDVWYRLNIAASAIMPSTVWTAFVDYTVNNTQSVALTVQKIDLWTSAQWHTWLLVNAKGKSNYQIGIKVDMWDWYGTAFDVDATNDNFNKTIWFNYYGKNIAFNWKISTYIKWKILKGTTEYAATTHDAPLFDLSHSGNYYAIDSVTWNFWLVDVYLECSNNTTAIDTDIVHFRRRNESTWSNGNITTQGTVLNLENTSTETSWILNDSVTILKLNQNSTSTWAHINFSSQTNVSAWANDWDMWFDWTNMKLRIWGATKTFTLT